MRVSKKEIVKRLLNDLSTNVEVYLKISDRTPLETVVFEMHHRAISNMLLELADKDDGDVLEY